MDVLYFLLGFLVGLALLVWQQTRSKARFRSLLHDIKADSATTPFSYSSQLALAMAHQQQICQRLELQVEDYQKVLYAAPVGYLRVDDENRLVWCNAKARELLEINPGSFLKPRLLLELVRSYELDELIEQTRDAQKPQQSEWTFRPANDDPSNLCQQAGCALRGHGFPLLDHQVGIFLENCQEAENLRQQRDRWASDVAHELKTPLTSIRLVAETLQSRIDPALRGWIDRLVNETIRLSNLVQDLLELSQLDRSFPYGLPLRVADLVELIQSAWLNLEPLARSKHLQIDYCGPEQLLIEIDEPRIYRVLLNLLDNSIKYSPPRQQIRVQLSIENLDRLDIHQPGHNSPTQQICLEVIDAGGGFPESSLPYVFERFYRADPSRARNFAFEEPQQINAPSLIKTEGADSRFANSSDLPDLKHRSGGSGLGLAIVRQIVEAHHGSVSASNHPETGGAWLQVRLPWLKPDSPK
ncbi:PAS domain-containing sensor histidine kinase [Oculatella sp. LEGE 06141]|uniref:ATP-binding protein n=1 Tax=Oculatella sp. LEGE 06141 TaxID=1828648 RepID=UPI0018802097|nr:PAS domain-containing sensor histidine kinase [Oculatella sp. LEGE 06141]